MASWRTRDGSRIDVRDMTDEHLANAAAFVERALQRWGREESAAYAYPGSGDMACYYAERAADEAGRKANACRGWLDVFAAEIAYRNRRT